MSICFLLVLIYTLVVSFAAISFYFLCFLLVHFANALSVQKEKERNKNYLEANRRTSGNVLNTSWIVISKYRDKHWILKLWTLFPYGFNNRINYERKDKGIHKLVGNRFPLLTKRKVAQKDRCMKIILFLAVMISLINSTSVLSMICQIQFISTEH